MSFAAKVDLWFLALFYGFGIAMLIGAPFRRRRRHGLWGGVLLTAIGLLFIGVGWRASAVTYLITADGFLDATGWPLDGRIAHVSEIQSVEPSHDARASHAASLDRLRIDYLRSGKVQGEAAKAGLIFIAVEEESAFLDALADKDANLIRTSTGLRRLPEDRAIDIGGHPRMQHPDGVD
jgi:hypothetical protein